MSLTTREDWREAWDTLAREREAYGIDAKRFPLLFGLSDTEGLREFLADDAAGTVIHNYREMVEDMEKIGVECPSESAAATLLAVTAQMYLELGLWLAQTGRVTV